MEYKQTLSNIDATVDTSNKIASMRFPWPLFIILLIIIALIIFLIWKFKDTLSSLWQSLTAPITDNRQIADAQQRTATNATLDATAAERLADAIDGTYSWYNDNEDALKSCIFQIKTPADWDLIVTKFGSRPCPNVLSFHAAETLPVRISRHSSNIAPALRTYLIGIGVNNPGF